MGNLGGELGMPILRQSVGFPITLLTVVGEWLHGWLGYNGAASGILVSDLQMITQ